MIWNFVSFPLIPFDVGQIIYSLSKLHISACKKGTVMLNSNFFVCEEEIVFVKLLLWLMYNK